MLSKSQFIVLNCMAALVIGLGLGWLPGCATHPGMTPTETPGKVDAAQTAVSAGSVVVSTEKIKGTAAPAPEAKKPDGDVLKAPDVDAVYRIGPGDMLSFRSFDDDKLSMSVLVRYDGCISLPIIPDLSVKDLTRLEAEERVKKAYSTFYVEPQLTLTIVEAKSKTYTVLGEVSRPAEYPYTRPISLLDAISQAGGIRVEQRGGDTYVGSQGQLVKALIIRHEGKERRAQDFDLRGFNKSGADPSDTPVLPGDFVYVPESANLVYVLGAVARPSVFALTPKLTLTHLLAFAGGFNETTARLKQVVIIREISDTETKVMTVDVRKNMKEGKDILLQPGDVIYLPRKWLVNAAEFVDQLTAPARSVMNFQQQLMGLYTQAFNTYHTKELYDSLLRNNMGSSTASLLQVENSVTNLSGQLRYVPTTSTTIK